MSAVGTVPGYAGGMQGVDKGVAAGSSGSKGSIYTHVGVIFGYYDQEFGDLSLISTVLKAKKSENETVIGRVELRNTGQKVDTLKDDLLPIVVGTKANPGALADIISEDQLRNMLNGPYVVSLLKTVPDDFSYAHAVMLIIDERVSQIFARVPDGHPIIEFKAIPWKQFQQVVMPLPNGMSYNEIPICGYAHSNSTLKILKHESAAIDALKERVGTEFRRIQNQLRAATIEGLDPALTAPK